jgi:hypothetical protein
MLDRGVWAEVKVGGEHLRLFSERLVGFYSATMRTSLPDQPEALAAFWCNCPKIVPTLAFTCPGAYKTGSGTPTSGPFLFP